MSDCLVLKTDRKAIWNQYGKTEERVAKDVKIIQDWLKTQNHLPEVPSDIMIQYFLTKCTFSIEKTKQSLDMYYSVRNLMPEIYRDSNPSNETMITAHDCLTVVPLPTLQKNFQRIVMCRFNNKDAKNWNKDAILAYLLSTTYETRIWEDVTMGDTLVLDLKHITMSLVTKYEPTDIKKTSFILEEIWNKDFKEIHLINVSSYADKLIQLARTFLHKDLREKIFVHKSLDDLHKAVSKDLLPQEYGGKEKTLDELDVLWRNKIKQYQSRFDKLDTMNVREDLRPMPYKNCEILGYYGNYMQVEAT